MIELALAGAVIAAVAFGIGTSLECECQKRARRARKNSGERLDELVDCEVAKMRKKGWL